MSVRILIGDMRERLKELPDNSVDSVVCDPPYHLTSGNVSCDWGSFKDRSKGDTNLQGRGHKRSPSKGFMGQTWDGGDVAFQPETWAEVLRVLKPGGHLVAFSGTRTYHRMAVAIEDAGFEVRDQLAWVYGSGFPKSHNLGDGWGTALKPSWEPIALCRKPLEGTNAANMAKWGVGGLNIDGCRIEGNEVITTHSRGTTTAFAKRPGENTAEESGRKVAQNRPEFVGNERTGRWPANLCHDGSDEVVAGFPETETHGGGDRASSKRQMVGWGMRDNYSAHDGGADSGSAARFFYCAKATTEERGEGNNHPTVKPVALMRWLVRLVTPKGGTVLDPFMGSGSTGLACQQEQFDFIGCEMSPEYAAIAERRLRADAGLFAQVQAA